VLCRDPVHRCLGTRSRFGLGLVVAGGVELEVAQHYAMGGDHADVSVFDQDEPPSDPGRFTRAARVRVIVPWNLRDGTSSSA
jgi:hypothetical protein